MPSTYAHKKFGDEMLSLFPQPTKEIILENLPLYNIGLHGPDLLFYYKPLGSNPVQQIGYGLHAKSASLFFEHAKEAYSSAEDKRAAYAYLVGFICHFVLDSACHGYIENKIAVSDVRHTEIETEFDKYLLRKEGKDPFKENLTAHITADERCAKVISPFFCGLGGGFAKAGEAEILKALKSMKFYNDLLLGRNPFKRGLVCAALKLSGNWREMHGTMFAKKDIAKCADSNMRLEKLFNASKRMCLYLTENYTQFLNGGELSGLFGATFGPCDDWQKIPVLDAEREKNYEVKEL